MVFADGFGQDVITDFDPTGGDVIDLTAVNEISNYGDLIANHMSQSGNNVTITAGGDRITLNDLLISELQSGDFALIAKPFCRVTLAETAQACDFPDRR
ncbi:MAG: hypothetical protein OIF48_06590 [Silicimonas sp.]|nr:hypothetical protein [Silicimonas sp.]